MAVGIIGLGIMGSAYTTNLVSAGFDVVGCDPSQAAQDKAMASGAVAHGAVGAWLVDCDPVILSLASPAALHSSAQALTEHLKPNQCVIETGTFTLDDKLRVRDVLSATGIPVLDCPVSGTGAQAATGDLLMMASGEEEVLDRCRPVLDAITKGIIYAGEFGAGSKMKFVANHAVAIHNCAAAEVLAYANSLGLEQGMVYEMLSTGAGASKMLELRMPLMMEDRYTPPTASLSMFDKDIAIIGGDMRQNGARTPLFDVCDALYREASAKLPKDYDAAAVYEIYRKSAEP